MGNQEPEMITTQDFLRKMDELKAQMEEQARERHRVNGVVHSSVNTLVLKTNAQDGMLMDIKGSLARIEECLIGDEKFNKVGLIKEVASQGARLILLEQSVATRTKIFFAVIGVLTAIGGFITWIKDLGFLTP